MRCPERKSPPDTGTPTDHRRSGRCSTIVFRRNLPRSEFLRNLLVGESACDAGGFVTACVSAYLGVIQVVISAWTTSLPSRSKIEMGTTSSVPRSIAAKSGKISSRATARRPVSALAR